MAPRISVLLPTYNGAMFVKQQIQSIQAQTEQSWEMLICDDGSVDGTSEVIAAFAHTDPRIRMLPSSGNKGQRRRIIELLAASSCDLIAFSDQDDVWDLNKLAILSSAIAGYDLVFGSSHLISDDGRSLGHTLLESLLPLPRSGDRLTYLFKPAVSAHAMLVRRTMVSDMSLRRGTHFDWLISLECAFRSGTVYVESAITNHRMHSSNQNNGFARAEQLPPSLLSKKSIKRYLFSRSEERLDLLTACEHLAESEVVSDKVSYAFAQARDLIKSTWYKPHKPKLVYRSLYDDLERLISPFAGSETDLLYAQYALKRMTTSPMSPGRIFTYARGD